MNAAAAKISMLKNSVRCLVLGLLGLLPVIGLPFAIAALVISEKVRVQERQFWNAARPCRIWGIIFAAIGIITCFLAVTMIIYSVANPNSGGSGYYGYGGGGD